MSETTLPIERLIVVEVQQKGIRADVDTNKADIATNTAGVADNKSANVATAQTIEMATQSMSAVTARLDKQEVARLKKLEDEAKAADQATKDAASWWKAWRVFFVPQNIIAIVTALAILGSIVTALFQGQADTADLMEAAAKLEAIQSELILPEPTPTPTPEPVEPDP